MTLAVAVRERPIIMTAESVRAILEGRKSQTRRVVKTQPSRVVKRFWDMGDNFFKPIVGLCDWDGVIGSEAHKTALSEFDAASDKGECIHCPYGVVGDRLWVRETWGYRGSSFSFGTHATYSIEYRSDLEKREFEFPHVVGADDEPPGLPRQRSERHDEDKYDYNDYLREYWAAWRSPIHIPRWASRLTLEITGIRVERLQEITDTDGMREGWQCDGANLDYLPRMWYRDEWNRLNEKRGYSWESNPWVWVIGFSSRRGA